ncbi:kinesin-like protein [Achlya hypogyna]|uniref:Kinesin-like protein n=1 Tax=Achlya hypogyna TaxID=1202772 RepID=A0A1V9YMT5_ACHHY|nr:kinesin-like protein [Achlya hypogyna]
MSSRSISFSRPATYNPELVRKATAEDDDEALRRRQMKEELGLGDDDDAFDAPTPKKPASNNAEWQQKCEDALAKLKVALENEEKAQSSLSKLQLLSKSQTAILKTTFEKKLKAKEAVVRDLLDAIAGHEASLRASNVAFRAFDVDGVVEGPSEDATAAADPLAALRAEMDALTEQNLALKKQLRQAADSPSPATTKDDPALHKKVATLEHEKANLLALLKDAQMKLTKARDSAAPPAAPDSALGDAKAAQKKLEAELKAAEKKIAALESEVTAAKNVRPAALAEAASSSADQAKLADLTSELAAATAKNAELEASFAAKHEKLKQTAEAELNKLKDQAKKSILDLRKKLEVSSKSSSELAARLGAAKAQLAAQRSDVAALRTSVTALVAQLPAAATDIAAKIEARVKVQAEALAGVVDNYRREMKERKRLFNMVQELQGNIRVLCRFRPISKTELANGSKVVAKFNGPEEVSLAGDKGKAKTYEFEHVFDMQSTQEQVFAQVKPLITSVLDGFNVCIFAYGQTGSGKTFTMSGSAANPGINPRALTELFTLKQSRRAEYADEIQVSIMEIYNEVIRDLLAENAATTNLSVRQGPTGNFVQGLTMKTVHEVDDVFNLIARGNQNRATSATDMNEHSSRSHSILSIYIKSTNVLTNAVASGKLHLVDLAGSERLSKTGAEGQRLKEAQNINQSLSTLGNVIQARANKQKHVPYRDSSLTYLLQDSLGGDSKTLMVACSSPVDYNAEETFCTLNFAARTRSVEMGKATKNVAAGKKE